MSYINTNDVERIVRDSLYKISKLDKKETIDDFDYLVVPEKCDDCFALGGNGICGYCKFSPNDIYDGPDDLLSDGRMPNCPFRIDIEIIKEQLINKINDL